MKVNDPEDMPLEHWRPGVETRMLVSARNGAVAIVHVRTMGRAGQRRADPFAIPSRRC